LELFRLSLTLFRNSTVNDLFPVLRTALKSNMFGRMRFISNTASS
jgi:hypothetical protein